MRVVDANKLCERIKNVYVEETEWENKKIVGKILDIIKESILTDASYSADHSDCYGDNFNQLIENLYTFYECTHGFRYRTFEEETECFYYGALHIAELMDRVFDIDAVAIANYICLIHNRGMLSQDDWKKTLTETKNE